MRYIAVIGLLLLTGCENWNWDGARYGAMYGWNAMRPTYQPPAYPRLSTSCSVIGTSVWCN